MFTFTAAENQASDEITAPYFEDARADFAPYYRSSVKISDAQVQVTAEMSKLGGGVYQIVQGVFDIRGQRRHGFEIRFQYGGAQGMIRVAGLPIKHDETKKKVNRVLVQALLNARDWLKSAVTSKVFNPGHDPLIGHLLLPDGQTTITDHIYHSGKLPTLESK